MTRPKPSSLPPPSAAPRSAPGRVIREKQIQAQGMAWLRAQGCLVFRRNVGSMSGEHKGKGWHVQFGGPGQSDTWLITPGGIHCEVEWKRPGNRPSLAQVQWLMKVNGHGKSAAWWVDNVETLSRVYRHIEAGGRIVYLDTVRHYSVKRGGKTVRIVGPSGDYDLG